MKMTKVQHRAVKDLAVRMCANYDRPTGDCLLMDEACWQVCVRLVCVGISKKPYCR